MCLAVPVRVERWESPTEAWGRAGSVEVRLRTDLLAHVAVGDLVLVHAGFAIEKLGAEDGAEREALWQEIVRLGGTRE